MLPPVYSSGVSFRLAEPSLQLVVVGWQLLSLLQPHPHEQALGPTSHDFGQVCREALLLLLVLARICGTDQWRAKRRWPMRQKTSQPISQPGKARDNSALGLRVRQREGQVGSEQ